MYSTLCLKAVGTANSMIFKCMYIIIVQFYSEQHCSERLDRENLNSALLDTLKYELLFYLTTISCHFVSASLSY